MRRSRYSSLISQGCHGINQLYYKIGIHRYESDYWYSVATVLGQALQHPSLQWIDPHVEILPDKGLRYLRTIIVIAGVHQRFGSMLRIPHCHSS